MLIIVAMTAVAALCWLLFHLATLALPLAVGIAAASFAHETGAGLLGAGMVGFLAGVMTLAAGQFLFANVRAPALRTATVLLFAAPAAIAGFSMVHGIMGSGGATSPWATLLALAGAIVTGTVAISKVSAPTTGGPG